MRLTIFSVFFLFFCFQLGYAQTSKPFTLNGKLPADAKGSIYLRYPSADKGWKTDSCLLNNGNFVFNGVISEPSVANLTYASKEIEIILEPAMMKAIIKDKNQLTNIEILGSPLQKELSELNNSERKVNARWKIVMDTLAKINKRSNAAYQEYRGWVLDPYFKEIKELKSNFINKYPSSLISAYALVVFGRDLSTDTLQYFYDRFPEAIKQSWYGKIVVEQLTKRKLGMPGLVAPEFTKEDINGKQLSLASLRGKYVLLDFWGSWCVPCRKGNPHLIKVYEKYKDRGFEIVGIAADDDTQKAWRKAVIDDKLPWLHILDGNISKKYGIASYPTKILIDKKGKIIGRFGSEEAEMDLMLESIFK